MSSEFQNIKPVDPVNWQKTYIKFGQSVSLKQCVDSNCESVGKFHCPYCDLQYFKATHQIGVQEHLEQRHWPFGVQFKDLFIVRCFLLCEGQSGGHYHCPVCTDCVSQREDFVTHIQQHLKDQDESVMLAYAPDAKQPPYLVNKDFTITLCSDACPNNWLPNTRHYHCPGCGEVKWSTAMVASHLSLCSALTRQTASNLFKAEHRHVLKDPRIAFRKYWHESIVRDRFDIPIAQCTMACCKKMFHCPLCTRERQAPTTVLEMRKHFSYHLHHAVVHKDYIHLACHLDCERPGELFPDLHYHCPHCGLCVQPRVDYTSHLQACSEEYINDTGVEETQMSEDDIPDVEDFRNIVIASKQRPQKAPVEMFDSVFATLSNPFLNIFKFTSNDSITEFLHEVAGAANVEICPSPGTDCRRPAFGLKGSLENILKTEACLYGKFQEVNKDKSVTLKTSVCYSSPEQVKPKERQFLSSEKKDSSKSQTSLSQSSLNTPETPEHHSRLPSQQTSSHSSVGINHEHTKSLNSSAGLNHTAAPGLAQVNTLQSTQVSALDAVNTGQVGQHYIPGVQQVMLSRASPNQHGIQNVQQQQRSIAAGTQLVNHSNNRNQPNTFLPSTTDVLRKERKTAVQNASTDTHNQLLRTKDTSMLLNVLKNAPAAEQLKLIQLPTRSTGSSTSEPMPIINIATLIDKQYSVENITQQITPKSNTRQKMLLLNGKEIEEDAVPKENSSRMSLCADPPCPEEATKHPSDTSTGKLSSQQGNPAAQGAVLSGSYTVFVSQSSQNKMQSSACVSREDSVHSLKLGNDSNLIRHTEQLIAGNRGSDSVKCLRLSDSQPLLAHQSISEVTSAPQTDATQQVPETSISTYSTNALITNKNRGLNEGERLRNSVPGKEMLNISSTSSSVPYEQPEKLDKSEQAKSIGKLIPLQTVADCSETEPMSKKHVVPTVRITVNPVTEISTGSSSHTWTVTQVQLHKTGKLAKSGQNSPECSKNAINLPFSISPAIQKDTENTKRMELKQKESNNDGLGRKRKVIAAPSEESTCVSPKRYFTQVHNVDTTLFKGTTRSSVGAIKSLPSAISQSEVSGDAANGSATTAQKSISKLALLLTASERLTAENGPTKVSQLSDSLSKKDSIVSAAVESASMAPKDQEIQNLQSSQQIPIVRFKLNFDETKTANPLCTETPIPAGRNLEKQLSDFNKPQNSNNCETQREPVNTEEKESVSENETISLRTKSTNPQINHSHTFIKQMLKACEADTFLQRDSQKSCLNRPGSQKPVKTLTLIQTVSKDGKCVHLSEISDNPEMNLNDIKSKLESGNLKIMKAYKAKLPTNVSATTNASPKPLVLYSVPDVEVQKLQTKSQPQSSETLSSLNTSNVSTQTSSNLNTSTVRLCQNPQTMSKSNTCVTPLTQTSENLPIYNTAIIPLTQTSQSLPISNTAFIPLTQTSQSLPISNTAIIPLTQTSQSLPISNTAIIPLTQTSQSLPISNPAIIPLTQTSQSLPISNTAIIPLTQTSQSLPISNTAIIPLTQTSQSLPISNTAIIPLTQTSQNLPISNTVIIPLTQTSQNLPISNTAIIPLTQTSQNLPISNTAIISLAQTYRTVPNSQLLDVNRRSSLTPGKAAVQPQTGLINETQNCTVRLSSSENANLNSSAANSQKVTLRKEPALQLSDFLEKQSCYVPVIQNAMSVGELVTIRKRKSTGEFLAEYTSRSNIEVKRLLNPEGDKTCIKRHTGSADQVSLTKTSTPETVPNPKRLLNEVETLKTEVHIDAIPVEQREGRLVFVNQGLSCKICRQRFEKLTELNFHIMLSHFKFKCPTCLCVYTKKELLEEHMRVAHRSESVSSHPKPSPFQCGDCEKYFPTRDRLDLHQRKAHNVPILCSICKATFTSLSSLKEHLCTIHFVENSAVCDVCGKSFRWGKYMLRHRARHFGEKVHECQICKKRLKDRSSLKDHLHIHKPTGERQYPYMCSTCGRRFNRKSNFHNHQKLHTGERPYVCRHCDKTFSTKANLRKHETFKHSDKRPFVCEICSKGFKSKDTLNKHMIVHTGQSKHMCSYCQRPFPSPSTWKAHMAKCDKKRSGSKITATETNVSATASIVVEELQGVNKPDDCLADITTQSQETMETVETEDILNDAFVYMCTACNKEFDDMVTAEIHIENCSHGI